jgi:hypothetical protein
VLQPPIESATLFGRSQKPNNKTNPHFLLIDAVWPQRKFADAYNKFLHPMTNSKALKILKDTYWSPTGWRRHYEVSKEDFAYAKRAGIMFDPEVISHDEGIMRANIAVRSADKKTIAKAFVGSLATRRLDLRSALGSYAIGRKLPVHSHATKRWRCSTCNTFDFSDKTDLSMLNFERVKWGGVRHTDPVYIAFDLQQFSRETIPEPSEESLEVFRSIISTARALAPQSRARDLEKAIAGQLKSNKQERENVLQILGYCGILVAQDKPGYLNTFVLGPDREVPPHGKIDWKYPFAWWRGSDKVRDDALAFWFDGII